MLDEAEYIFPPDNYLGPLGYIISSNARFLQSFSVFLVHRLSQISSMCIRDMLAVLYLVYRVEDIE